MKKTEQDYLNMQRAQYEEDASRWTIEKPDPVVGSYHAHNAWQDYDDYLFKGIDTDGKIAIEYGCGPGRNLIKFHSRFARIDGVDIASNNLTKASLNLQHAFGNYRNNLYQCSGKNLPVGDNSYDVAFSVICLQHICSYSIRYAIMEDIYRILKPGGHFCFQMGYGGRACRTKTAMYHDDIYDAERTNSAYDVTVNHPDDIKGDLEKIGFDDFDYDIRPTGPGDTHANWIWVRTKK